MNQLKLFSFYLLNDTKSENTLMLLKFLDNNINILNKKGVKVKFNLINQDEIKKEEFLEFIKKKNIKNIPCIVDEINNDVISGMEDILHLLKVLTDENKNKNKKNNGHIEEEDEEEKYNSFMQNYIYSEMTKPDNDDERFDEENSKKDLGDKLRALEKQRKGGGTCKYNNNNNNNSNNNNNNNNNYMEEEDECANKIANKVKIKIDRDIDQDSLTKQLLDKLDDD